MSDDSAELHVKVRHRNRPPKPYKWEIYRENDPICIKRAMHGYRTQQAAANAGEKALRRFLESEALKQEQGIVADKHYTLVGGNVQDFHDSRVVVVLRDRPGPLAMGGGAAVPIMVCGGILEIRNWWVFRATSQRGPGVAVR